MQHHSERAFLLISSLLVITGLASLVMVGLTRAMTEQLVVQHMVLSERALALAEAGIDDTLSWLRTQPVPPSGDELFFPFGGDGATGPTPQFLDAPPNPEVFYTVQVFPAQTNPISPEDFYTIMVDGTANGTTRTVSAVVRTETFTRFAFYEGWGTELAGAMPYFVSGDVISGPAYGKHGMFLSGTPIFLGPVSTTELVCENGCHPAEPDYGPGHPAWPNWPGDDPDFQGGLILNPDPVPLPDKDIWWPGLGGDGGILEAAAAAVYHDAIVYITLNGNEVEVTGSYFAGEQSGEAIHDTYVVSDDENTLIFVEPYLFIDGGELDGKLTLAARDLNIKGDITYHCDPETLLPESSEPPDADCFEGGELVHNDDLLGLIGAFEVDIYLDEAPIERRIQAVMLGWSTLWAHDGDDDPDTPNGPIHIFGGMLIGLRGNFDYVGGPYQKDFVFDPRLFDMQPPFFPRGDPAFPYERLLWQEDRVEANPGGG